MGQAGIITQSGELIVYANKVRPTSIILYSAAEGSTVVWIRKSETGVVGAGGRYYFRIRFSNPGTVSTDTYNKISFLILNPS